LKTEEVGTFLFQQNFPDHASLLVSKDCKKEEKQGKNDDAMIAQDGEKKNSTDIQLEVIPSIPKETIDSYDAGRKRDV